MSGDHSIQGNRAIGLLFERAAGSYEAVSNAYTMSRRAEALAAWVCGSSIEIGGGTGAVSSRLADQSKAFHSDISVSMCRLARQKLQRPGVCFDAECIPVASESFDSVVAAEMIYYLARPETFAAEAHRILRPGGRLILSTTNPLMTWLERGRSVLRKLGLPGMFFDDGSPDFLKLKKVCEMLEKAGFQIEHRGGVVPMPFSCLDWCNRILERTPAWRLSLFFIVVATKPLR